MPSMPTHFWNDADGHRYRDAYFDMFPGVWRHGDWATWTERGSFVIHVLVAPAIPHTRTGKKLEVPLKRVFQGANPDAVVDLSAVDRAEAVEWFTKFSGSCAGAGVPLGTNEGRYTG